MTLDCPTCGMRSISAKDRHERGLTHQALLWLRRHPNEVVSAKRLARQLMDAKMWSFDLMARTPPGSRVGSTLYELEHIGYVTRVAPGQFTYTGD